MQAPGQLLVLLLELFVRESRGVAEGEVEHLREVEVRQQTDSVIGYLVMVFGIMNSIDLPLLLCDSISHFENPELANWTWRALLPGSPFLQQQQQLLSGGGIDG